MAQILSIAAYRFVTLNQLADRRQELRKLCEQLDLRGSILLAPEGINLFLAGETARVESFIERLTSQAEFTELRMHRSRGDRQPFRRMSIRLKKEIIAFGVDGIEPQQNTSPKLAPQDLKLWLAEKRDFTLLDVRNDYEVGLGTFDGADAAGIDHFRDFPDAVERFPGEWKSRPLVMFCTGGIRCEKAGPLLERAGYEHVFQLDGGILNYFETCGADYYKGDCFVFDHRVALNPEAGETSESLCLACQGIVSESDRRSPHYVEGRSCPHCYRLPASMMTAQISARRQAIAAVVDPLPGSRPYRSERPLKVPPRLDRSTTLDVLDAMLPFLGRSQWEKECKRGRVLKSSIPVSGETVLRSGEQLCHVEHGVVEPDVNGDIQILWEDESIVVVNKPAPLPMHPCGRFNRNSLVSILNQVYAPEQVRIGHRLDSNTSGVVVLSRRRSVASRLQPQFAEGTVKKTYLALVQDDPAEESFYSEQAIASKPLKAGLRTVDPNGSPARTDFRVMRRNADGTTLLRVTPKTGRTNQIRIHLWALGLPIVGDPSYLPHGRLGETQTLDIAAPPMCLHAWKLEFDHPETGKPIRIEAPLPSWAE